MASPVYWDFNLEMEQVQLYLTMEADLVADRLEIRIKQMMSSGMSRAAILDVLRRDLAGGGPLFSGFATTFKNAVFPVIDDAAQGAVMAANPNANRWEWITTSVEPCPDCLPRHGQTKAYKEWESLGLPRSGFSRCGDNCKCALVPAGAGGASLGDGPVEVPTLAQARAAFKQDIATDPALKAKMDAYRAERRKKTR